MPTIVHKLMLVITSMGLVCLVHASTSERFTVDDTQSQLLQTTVKMEWQNWSPPTSGKDTLTGNYQILLKLDVSPWVSKKARIYMRFNTRQHMSFSYRGQDWIGEGVIQNKESRLIYEGMIATPIMQDLLTVKMFSSANELTHNDQLQSTFELEIVE